MAGSNGRTNNAVSGDASAGLEDAFESLDVEDSGFDDDGDR